MEKNLLIHNSGLWEIQSEISCEGRTRNCPAKNNRPYESTDEEDLVDPPQSHSSIKSEVSSDRSKASEERDGRNVEDDNTLDEGVDDVIVEGDVDKLVE